MKLIIRIVLFYFCLSLFSTELVSFALKYKDFSALSVEIEKEKEGSEERKSERDSEIEDFYLFHGVYSSLAQFDYYFKKDYLIENEKLVSQVHKEISTPPPNS